MAYSGLQVFDKSGQNLQMAQDVSGVYQGKLLMGELSVHLFENQQLYFLQSLGNDLVTPYTSGGGSLSFALERGGQGFSFYVVDDDSFDYPVIKEEATTNLVTIDTSTASTEVNKPLVLSLLFRPTTGGEFMDNIIITDENDDTIGRIELYGVGITESENILTFLRNFGKEYCFLPEHARIVKNVDINEGLPDFKVLNAKRKEVLVEKHNIFPFEGAYKGIINALKLFGYENIGLVEFWKNLLHEQGVGQKYVQERILNVDGTWSVRDDTFLTDQFRKTRNFGLFYQINEVIPNSFDEYNLPITRKNFLFTNEEVLIKLNGLRNWIETCMLAGYNSYITDITGEAVFFYSISVDKTLMRSEIYSLTHGNHKDFTVTPSVGHLSSLRPIQIPDTRVEFSSTVLNVEQNDLYGIQDVENYGEIEQLPDDPTNPIGQIVNLTAQVGSTTFGDLGLTFGEINYLNFSVTFESINLIFFSDLCWKITNSETRVIEYEITGKPLDLYNHDVIINKSGIYDVEMLLIDYSNSRRKLNKPTSLTVYSKEVDFVAFFRARYTRFDRWNTNNLQFGDVYQNFEDQILPPYDAEVVEAFIQDGSLEAVQYNLETGVENDNLNYGWHAWRSFRGITWGQLPHAYFGVYELDNQKPAFFYVDSFDSIPVLTVGDDTLAIPNDVNRNDFDGLATYLNGVSSVMYPDIRSFIFYGIDRGDGRKRLMAVSEWDDKTGTRSVSGIGVEFSGMDEILTFEDAEFSWAFGGAGYFSNLFVAEGVSNGYNLSNTLVQYQNLVFPLGVPVGFRWDASGMVGKTTGTWTLEDDTGSVVVQTTGPFLVYTFFREGLFNLKLQVEDNQGNVKSTSLSKKIVVRNEETI